MTFLLIYAVYVQKQRDGCYITNGFQLPPTYRKTASQQKHFSKLHVAFIQNKQSSPE